MTVLGLALEDRAHAGPPIRQNRASWPVWVALGDWIADDQNNQCLLCGRSCGLTLHHVVRRRDGGIDCRANLIGMCGACHVTLHLVERDLSLWAKLLTVAMVLFGPSPAFCRFLRGAFPVLIRRGSGFHPAKLRLRLPRLEFKPVAARNLTRLGSTTAALVGLLFMAGSLVTAQDSRIAAVQEREAREAHVVERVEYQFTRAKLAPVTTTAVKDTEPTPTSREALRRAVERVAACCTGKLIEGRGVYVPEVDTKCLAAHL